MRTEAKYKEDMESERKTDVERTRKIETPVKQRRNRQCSWPPL